MTPATFPLSARLVALTAALALTAAACGSDDPAGPEAGAPDDPVTVRLVTHDSFAASEEVLDAFTAETGITVETVAVGDAGVVVNQAILTKDNPLGDVLFGVDNTLLSRALDAEIFEPYESPLLDQVDPAYLLDPEHRVTPSTTARSA